MTSTLWFWIVLILLVLIIFFLIKRYLGRFLLICLFLVVLFFVYKWIFPKGGAALLNRFETLPTRTVNFVNRELLKNTIELGEKNIDGVLDIEITSGTVSEEFSGNNQLFPSDANDLLQNEGMIDQTGSISSRESILLPAENQNLLRSGSQILQPGSKENNEETSLIMATGEHKKTGTVSEEAPEEVYYLPSNPKPASSPKKTTSSSSLSAEDLREAREIFGN